MSNVTLKLLLILCGVFWSVSGVLVKELAVLGVMDPFLIAAIRAAIGILFLLPLIRSIFSVKHVAALLGFKRHAELAHAGIQGWKWRSVLFVGAAAYVTNILLLVWAFQHTNAASAVFLHYGGLLLICVFSTRVLRQTPAKIDYFALALFFVGMAILVKNGFDVHEIAPTLAGVGCGITFAMMQLALAKLSQWDQDLHLELSLGLECQLVADVATVFIGGLVAAANHTELPHTPAAWLALTGLGVIAWGLPNVVFILLLRINPLLDSLLFGLGDPLFTALWPIVFGFDALRASPLIGSMIIFSALVLKAVIPKRKNAG